MRLFFLPAILCAASASASLAMVACSGDDSSGNGTTGRDASADGTTSDGSGSNPDTGANDAGTKDTGSQSNDGGACTPFDAAGLDDGAVQQGLAAVQQFHCANCHQTTPADAGITLSGRDTPLPNDAGATVYPPNLTPDQSSGLGCWSNDQITNAMLNGIDDQGAHLCVMPKFSTKGMDAGTALAIAQFLRSLPAVSHQVPDSVCPVDNGDGGSGPGDGGQADAADAGPSDSAAGDAQTD
jgi:hypothetical protein